MLQLLLAESTKVLISLNKVLGSYFGPVPKGALFAIQYSCIGSMGIAFGDGCQLRTSIFPVTAAEMMAVRRSFSNSICLSEAEIKLL